MAETVCLGGEGSSEEAFTGMGMTHLKEKLELQFQGGWERWDWAEGAAGTD